MEKKISILLLVFSICAVFFISVHQRFYQYNEWKKNKNIYFVDQYPAVTTLDAYYWLRYAQIKANIKKKPQFDLNGYPEIHKFPDHIPSLSLLIAKSYKFFNSDGYNPVYVGGIKFINFVSGLFIIPLILFLYFSGGGFSGILGGLIGTFSWAYYVRSCTGRVDTDGLVLFAPITIALIMLISVISKKKTVKFLFSGLSGLLFLILSNFHEAIHVGYIGYLILFILSLWFNNNRKFNKDLGICILLFILFSNPLNLFYGFKYLMNFLGSSYFFNFASKEVEHGIKIVLPNIISTITETQRLSYDKILNMMFTNKFLAMVGLLSSIVYFLKNYKKSLLLLPVFAIGCLSFFTSNRFSMFLAPFVGIGLGYIISLIIYYIYHFLRKKEHFSKSIIEVACCFILFFVIARYTAYSYVPRPSISAPIIKSFIDMDKKFGNNKAVYTWWDFGYALMDVGNFYTYHDGGKHGGIRTYLVAKGMTIDNQRNLYNMIGYLDDNGFNAVSKIIEENKSSDYMLSTLFNYSKPVFKRKKDIYILYTNDMIGKYSSISFFGNWDFNSKKSNPDSYQQLRCSQLKDNQLYCGNIIINLNNGIGKIGPNRQFNIRKSFFIDNGYIIRENNYNNKNGYYLELLMRNNNIFSIYIINDRLFRSNFNQQYILGKVDTRYFKEVYNNFPFARLFKVIKP